MSEFISENFLLKTKVAQELYHNYATDLPIIDYHCHLLPADIAGNKNFKNLTKIWLDGDHYKWRVMRTLGIDERFITGNASDKQKFLKWAKSVPYMIRNPLYHWSHMELKNYFGVGELLNENNAEKIYHVCSEQLQESSFSTQSLIKKMNVETICTTDDPTDSLIFHKQIKSNSFGVDVLPAFRPDHVYDFDDVASYNNYLNKLEKVSNITISTLDDLMQTLEQRINFFHEQGCRLSDHGLQKIPSVEGSNEEVGSVFTRIRKGKSIDRSQKNALTYRILIELAKIYETRGWVQQYHLGALRSVNERMVQQLGPATGFDSIGDFAQGQTLACFLNELDSTDQLAKTILYNLNPRDNEVLATMTGNFNDGSVKGKMQFGSAWWFLDQKDGIEKQLNTLSNMGLLSCFVGMLTDSRSFLSYPRHEYFRRVLCNLIGRDVENGELPKDISWLGKIVADICYYNAKEYFNLIK